MNGTVWFHDTMSRVSRARDVYMFMTYGWKTYGTHVLTSMIFVVQFAGWYKGSVLIGQ